MKHLIVAVMIAAMAIVATEARADNFISSVPLSLGTNFFGAVHTDSVPFTDEFNFIVSGSLVADASLVTIGFIPGQNIDFAGAFLNGSPFTLSGPGAFEFGFILPASYGLPLQLLVFGFTDAGGGVNSSYSGTVNVTSLSVPEPASLMLLGAGLAGIGIWRRKSTKV